MRINPIWYLFGRRVASKIIAPYLALIFVLTLLLVYLSAQLAASAFQEGVTVGSVFGCVPAGACSQALSFERRVAFEISRQLTLAVAPTVFFVLLIGLWVARSITQPLTALVRAAEQAARGDLPPAMPVTRQDELGALARSLNELVEQLRRYREA